MATTVGGVIVNIGANIDGLTTGINNAKATVRSGVDSIQGAAQSMQGYLAAIGVGLSIGAFAGWIKGAIDAADETSKMAQKIGVATEEVAGLQLAFRQAGVGDAFEQSMAKLSKSAAAGSDAFAAMGINVKSNDGALKSTRALLGEVADGMESYADGAAKSALAQELFGKSGAQLIPLLNAGSQALDDYDATAKKLGLTLSEDTAKEAEKFNDTMDLIGQGSQGVARQIGAQLLPTLSGLAEQFLTSMTSGDKLANTAQFLANLMKVLYMAGLGVVEVFSTVGKTLGGVSAAVVAALTGDFAGAANILKEMKADIGSGWKDTLKQMQGAWTATGSSAVDALTSAQKGLKATAPLLAELEKQTKAQTKATKDQEAAQKQADAELMKIMRARADLRLKESDGIEAYMLAEQQARNSTIKASNEALAAAQAEYDNYGKTRSQLAEVTLARLEDKLQAYHAGTDNANAVLLEIENQKKLIAILQKTEVREAAKKSAEDAEKAWEETAKSIESALTDSLMRGFESGKSMVDSVRDYISNAFKSIVVKMAVQPIMGAIGGLFGMGGASASTGGAGGGGGIMDTLGGLFGGGGSGGGIMGSLGGLLSFTGTGFGAGLGATLGGVGTMGGLSAGASLLGTGTMAGAASGAGMMLGAAAPWIAGAMALKSLTDYKVTPNGGGITASLTSSGTSTGMVGAYQQFLQEGGLGGGGNTTNRTWSQADQGTTSYIIDSVKANTEANKAYARTLGLNAEALDGYTKNIEINTAGMTDAAARTAIDAELTKFSAEQISQAYGSVLAEFALAGETAAQTLQRLAMAQGAATALNELGGIFTQIALGGVGATSSMIQLAGGIDKLMAKATGFVKDYYSTDEQNGIMANSVLQQLNAAGVQDAQLLNSKEDFRALVESIDVSTETGRQQLNALLSIAPQFAQLADTFAAQNIDLGVLASLAPQSGVLSPLFGDASSTDATESTTASINATTDAINAGTTAVVKAIETMAERMTAAVTTTAAANSTALNNLATQVDGLNNTARLDLAAG